MAWTIFRRQHERGWYIEWMEGTERHHRSLDTEDEAEAFRRAAGMFPPAPDSDDPPGAATYAQAGYTIAHALEDLLNRGLADNADGTRSCYLQRAGHLIRCLGGVPLAALHLDQVQEYVDGRLAEGAARETIRKELCVLRRALDLAHRRGIPGPVPADVLPRFRTRYVPRKRWLTPGQVSELAAQLERHRQLWLLVAVYTGGRLSELQRMDWQDLSFGDRQVHLRGRKTGQSDRFVPLHPRLLETLLPLRRVRGTLLEAWPNVRRDLAAACKRAGVPLVTPNDLRRTFASWLVQAGESSHVVAQLLGHSSSQMVEKVYGRLAQKTLQDAISKLP